MTAEEIVRRLAAVEDPSVEDRDYAPAAMCGLCDEGTEAYKPMAAEDHAPDCPWIQARRWVAEQGREGVES